MSSPTLHSSFLLLGGMALLASPALAGPDSFVGVHEMEGSYSDRRSSDPNRVRDSRGWDDEYSGGGEETVANVTIEETERGLRVTRRGTFTHTGETFTWTSEVVPAKGDQLITVYRVPRTHGIAGGLSGTTSSSSAMILQAVYTIASDGALVEQIFNTTPTWWSNIRTRGRPHVDPPVDPPIDPNDPLRPYLLQARAMRSQMVAHVLLVWTDVFDYFEPGDGDRYRQAEHDLLKYVNSAKFEDEGFVPHQLSGEKMLRVRGATSGGFDDPLDGGYLYVLFGPMDGKGQISSSEVIYAYDGAAYVGSGDDVDSVRLRLGKNLVGTIESVEFTEVDPYAIGDAALMIVAEQGTGRRYGFRGDFDNPSDAFDEKNVGKQVLIRSADALLYMGEERLTLRDSADSGAEWYFLVEDPTVLNPDDK